MEGKVVFSTDIIQLFLRQPILLRRQRTKWYLQPIPILLIENNKYILIIKYSHNQRNTQRNIMPTNSGITLTTYDLLRENISRQLINPSYRPYVNLPGLESFIITSNNSGKQKISLEIYFNKLLFFYITTKYILSLFISVRYYFVLT